MGPLVEILVVAVDKVFFLAQRQMTTPALVATFVLYAAFKLSTRILSAILLLAVARSGMGRPEAILFGLGATTVHVVIYGGLGLLLTTVAASGLRRNIG